MNYDRGGALEVIRWYIRFLVTSAVIHQRQECRRYSPDVVDDTRGMSRI